jgi:23S rRNA U2552 (ribose-2'-O)-methylase RlmE/FtsJ
MEIQKNITQHTDLETIGGYSSFQGYLSQQHHNAYQVFYDFIKDIKPKRILEIGTAHGGFIRFLKTVCNDLNLDTDIRTYDIQNKDTYQSIIDFGVDVRIKNIFNSDFSDVDKEVKDYINEDGITLVLCDGGFKIGEFKALSKFIKPGDFIMAHDYAETLQVFHEKILNKIWGWCEITDFDIHQATSQNSLIIYNREAFENVVWTCRKKYEGSTKSNLEK